MKKKVVHIVYSMGCGGLEKVIVNLINGSDETLEHTIITLISDFEMVELIESPVRVYCVNKRPGKDIGCHFRILKLLFRIRPDIVNTYNFGTIEYHLMAAIAGVKRKVHSDHGHGGDAADGLNKRNNAIRRFCSRFVDDYVVVSQDLFDWVKQVVKIKSKRVHIVQNGVPIPKERQKLSHDGLVFCTVGRLDPIKNQKLLIQAFSLLVKKHPNERLILKIVGDGSERSNLEQLVSELNIEDNVQFLGYRDDIQQQLLSSDVFVLSSHYEAMPMTILESMATKIPVVTTDVGGIKHFIGESNATFVEPGNAQALAEAMINATKNTPQKEALLERSYQLVVDKYSLEAMCKTYCQIYGVYDE